MMDTFPKLLLQQATVRGNQSAVRIKRLGLWEVFSWEKMLAQTKAVTFGLLEIGVRPGDAVAIISSNTPEVFFSISAVQIIGAIAVPLHADITEDQLANALNKTRVRCAFAQDQQQVDALLGVMPKCPQLRQIIYVSPRGLANYDKTLVWDIRDVMESGSTHAKSHPSDYFEQLIEKTKEEDIAFIFFSSGVSALAPKAVPLTYRNLLSVGRHIAEMENINEHDEILSFMPIAMSTSILYGYVLSHIAGFCVSFPESTETVLENLREIGPTLLYAPPHVYKYLVSSIHNRIKFSGGMQRWLYRKYAHWPQATVEEAPKSSLRKFFGCIQHILLGELMLLAPIRNIYGLSHVRLAMTGDDSVSDEVIAFFHMLGVHVRQMYGSTETSACIMISPQKHSNGAAKFSEHAIEGAEIKLADNAEILCRGVNTFAGYYNDEDATREAFDEDGWFRTGDMGRLGDDGVLQVIDRLDAIGKLNNGQTFMPKLIENQLKSSPYIKNAFVTEGRGDFLLVIVVVDDTSTSNWADQNNVRYTGYADLTAHPEVENLVCRQLSEANKKLAATMQPSLQHFAILGRDFSMRASELSWTNKLCRLRLAETMSPLVNAICDNQKTVAVTDMVSEVRAEYNICSV